MEKQIFVNLPVKNLDKSKEFFSKLGYTFNAQFTDEKAACMVISETIYTMLLVESFFKTFVKKQIADTSKCMEAIICLSADSKEQVDDIINKAIAVGGKVPNEKQDMGFMYSRGFEDLDGHYWEIMWMDPAAVQG